MINVEHIGNCLLCNSSQLETLYEGVKDSLFDAEGEWTFRLCNSCHMLLLDPRPIPDEMFKTYTYSYSNRKLPNNSKKNNMIGKLKDIIQNSYFKHFHGYYALKGSIFFSFLPFLIPSIRKNLENKILRLDFIPGGRLLDVGCGVGDFLHQMHLMGWNAEGVDNDLSVVEICRKRNLNARVGFLEELKYPDNYFDVILLKHVIEHVHNPVELLNECKRILKFEGKIIILTPNYESRTHKLFGRYWLGLDVSRHFYIFSFLAIFRLLQKAGLKVFKARSTTRISKFVWLASYLNQRFGKSIYKEKTSIFENLQSKLFLARLRIELLFNKSAGDELEVVAIKK